ncbi:hypothetical protein JST97_10950 [bacterium]|nr:hypothetical protein [bacterium]
MLDRTELSAYRMASAIARLAWLRSVGDAYWSELDGQGMVEVHFHGSGPSCKCCGKPLDRSRWLRTILGDYGPELRRLLPLSSGGI